MFFLSHSTHLLADWVCKLWCLSELLKAADVQTHVCAKFSRICANFWIFNGKVVKIALISCFWHILTKGLSLNSRQHNAFILIFIYNIRRRKKFIRTLNYKCYLFMNTFSNILAATLPSRLQICFNIYRYIYCWLPHFCTLSSSIYYQVMVKGRWRWIWRSLGRWRLCECSIRVHYTVEW